MDSPPSTKSKTEIQRFQRLALQVLKGLRADTAFREKLQDLQKRFRDTNQELTQETLKQLTEFNTHLENGLRKEAKAKVANGDKPALKVGDEVQLTDRGKTFASAQRPEVSFTPPLKVTERGTYEESGNSPFVVVRQPASGQEITIPAPDICVEPYSGMQQPTGAPTTSTPTKANSQPSLAANAEKRKRANQAETTRQIMRFQKLAPQALKEGLSSTVVEEQVKEFQERCKKNPNLVVLTPKALREITQLNLALQNNLQQTEEQAKATDSPPSDKASSKRTRLRAKISTWKRRLVDKLKLKKSHTAPAS
jgi:hypothetical protein